MTSIVEATQNTPRTTAIQYLVPALVSIMDKAQDNGNFITNLVSIIIEEDEDLMLAILDHLDQREGIDTCYPIYTYTYHDNHVLVEGKTKCKYDKTDFLTKFVLISTTQCRSETPLNYTREGDKYVVEGATNTPLDAQEFYSLYLPGN